MSFGNEFLKGFFGSDYLKDFTHASKTFRSDSYALAPKNKFLFYVRFNLNNNGISALKTLFPQQNELGVVVKSVDLPSYQFDTDVYNQYNRKRLVQSKVNYEPIGIRFHDDNSNLITNLWYNYFSYYYKDSSHEYNSQGDTPFGSRVDYNDRDTYTSDRDQNEWGYIGESYSDGDISGKPRFFNDITIFGLSQQQFTQYTLINPIIQNWKHDTYDYAEGNGIMEHNMTVLYEAVKYKNGAISDSTVPGFTDNSHYDNSPSTLQQGTNSVLGPGGVIDNAEVIYNAIRNPSTANILAALKAGANLEDVLKNPGVVDEAIQIGKQIIRNQGPSATRTIINRSDSVFFPKPEQAGTTTTNTPKSATDEITGPTTRQVPGGDTWT